MTMKKLLWIGDAACPSGFARATHAILDMLRREYDVTVLGMNYRGDPHPYPYPIFTAFAGGDAFGVGRLVWMCDLVKPDVIVLQNDGWNIQPYVRQLRRRKPNGKYMWPEYAGIPIVAALAVDGKNLDARWLDGLAHVVFWTQFALDEAREAGYEGPASVVPLGVDTTVYHPADKMEARSARGIASLGDAFIVGNVNRNQPRKRWDLTVRYFAEWVKSKKVSDAYLYLHVAPTGDMGVDVKQLAKYYGVLDHLALMEPPTWYGIAEEEMRDTYNCFDVQVTTTQGEGFGLTTFEGMACGVPQIVPDWAALGELCAGAAWMVPCTSTAINPVAPGLNVIGGVPDEGKFIEALDALYRHPDYRETNRAAALERARQPRFRWENVGAAWLAVIAETLRVEKEAVA
ncbi:MAG: glycosyltransferase family 4 protein [Sulfuricaulis sp.]|nr:glycosyltransferase family 4 protein [Sulfuricaulis sp.]